MKKFLTVLLALSVVFTYTVGTAFAATVTAASETFTSADYENEYSNQWTDTYNHKLTLAEQDYAKNKLILSGNHALYGIVTASDLGLKAAGTGDVPWTDKAFEKLVVAINGDITTARTKFTSKKIEENFGKDATSTEVDPATFNIGNADVYTGITLDAMTADGDGYKTAVDVNEDKFFEYQAEVIYDAVVAKVTTTLESNYTDENANKVAAAKAKALNKVTKAENSNKTNENKSKEYLQAFAEFKATVDKIDTIEDGEYNDAEAATKIAEAVAAFVKFGLGDVYNYNKLVEGRAVDSELLNVNNDTIVEKITDKKYVIFGVEIADVTNVTKAEATKVNTAMRNAIIASGEIVQAYAEAVDVDTLTERVNAVFGLYNEHRNEFLASLNKAMKAAADVYADVVAEGESMKATVKYGVKVYDDAKVTQAVKDAEALVYADLKDGFKTPAKYIALAAKKGGYTLEAQNFEYQAFMAAIDAAKAKFFKANGTTPQVKVLYGENKTAEADYVYLKATYARVEAEEWTKIANEAVAALEIAESYDDIDAALAKAAADMGELMLAADEATVRAAINKHVAALSDSLAEAKKIMGTKDYSAKAYNDAFEAGKKLIEDADTVEEVKSAYADAEALIRNIPTIAELDAAQKAVIEKIAALPTVSTLTATDKDAVVAVLNAYIEYSEMYGADVTGITNTYTLNTALDTVLRIVGKDLQDRVDDMVDAIKKCDPSTDNGAEALVAMEDEIKALLVEAEDFNDLLKEVAKVASLKVDAVAHIVKLAKLESVLDAENAIWNAELHNLLAAANTAKTAAEKSAVLDMYSKLTDRQQYKMEQNLKTLIEEFKAEIVNAVESMKVVKNHSVVGKGYIKIAWSTIGDETAIDGFKVYKSTKANSGYKYTFTTANKTYKNTKGLKKGTRYYYKVRAYKVVDGKTYYSDYSNKAYRVAK